MRPLCFAELDKHKSWIGAQSTADSVRFFVKIFKKPLAIPRKAYYNIEALTETGSDFFALRDAAFGASRGKAPILPLPERAAKAAGSYPVSYEVSGRVLRGNLGGNTESFRPISHGTKRLFFVLTFSCKRKSRGQESPLLFCTYRKEAKEPQGASPLDPYQHSVAGAFEKPWLLPIVPARVVFRRWNFSRGHFAVI